MKQQYVLTFDEFLLKRLQEQKEYHCSDCGEAGHNAASCSSSTKETNKETSDKLKEEEELKKKDEQTPGKCPTCKIVAKGEKPTSAQCVDCRKRSMKYCNKCFKCGRPCLVGKKCTCDKRSATMQKTSKKILNNLDPIKKELLKLKDISYLDASGELKKLELKYKNNPEIMKIINSATGNIPRGLETLNNRIKEIQDNIDQSSKS